MSTPSMRLSLEMQSLSELLDRALEVIAGERLSFVLVVQADKIAQYSSNCDRKDGKELIESLLQRWKSGRADIPAHYNPDLQDHPDLRERP